MTTLLLMCVVGGSPKADGSYLGRTTQALSAYRADLPVMAGVADQAAGRLARGGKLLIAGAPGLISEFTGRAGGFMMARGVGDTVPCVDDVVLYFPDSPSTPALSGPLVAARKSGALVISFVDGPDLSDAVSFHIHAKEAGTPPIIAMAACGWVFTGELIGALTRLGKMPVIYESIGGYGGWSRIQKFKNGEIGFHDQPVAAPAVAPGVLGGRFIDVVSAILRRVESEERRSLDRAGEWAEQAKASGKQLYMYSMGHVFPDVISKTDIGKLFHSDVWNAGFRGLPRPGDKIAAGDLVVHIGYQQPPDVLLREARPAGARVVYVSVRHDRDFTRDEDVIWIDPMWDWPDSCVTIESYDIPILPASGVVNGSIAWEIYRLASSGLGSKS